MGEFIDKEFGEIRLKHVRGSKRITARVATDGRLTISMPLRMPTPFIRQFISTSREKLRELLQSTAPPDDYIDGSQIGKSHTLIVRSVSGNTSRITIDGQQVVVSLSAEHDIHDTFIQRMIRDEVITILRKQAKSYLPRRLKYIAKEHNFSYERTRLSHASSRWGSCSTTGTISLNIALMKLQHELIDYVIMHELAHTRQMNHSPAFWREVEQLDPHYKLHRRQLKSHSPSI